MNYPRTALIKIRAGRGGERQAFARRDALTVENFLIGTLLRRLRVSRYPVHLASVAWGLILAKVVCLVGRIAPLARIKWTLQSMP